MAGKNSLFMGRKLEQDPGYKEEPYWIKEEKESKRDTAEQIKRGRERIQIQFINILYIMFLDQRWATHTRVFSFFRAFG